MDYKKRHIESAIEKGDKSFKAILVTGARQTGNQHF